MASVTVQLDAATEQTLRQYASRCGQTLEAYLRQLAESDANREAAPADMLARGLEWLRPRGPDEIQAARRRVPGASLPPRELPAGQSVVEAIEGKWPGTESDAEISDALRRIS